MPLTDFQSDIFKVISHNRNPDSYVAGATVIHRKANSSRYSRDIDLFHDTAEAVVKSAELDAKTLTQAGYKVEFSMQQATFHRASVECGDKKVRLEWAADSAFRFFPIIPDETLGFRLHDADAATNKVLAAAGREKVRDFIDLMHVDQNYMSLGIAIWAAVSKDEGYTPEFIIDQLRRHGRINPASIGNVVLTHPIDAVTLKKGWLECLDAAQALIPTLPSDSLGCLYLDSNSQPVRGKIFDPAWQPHFGCVKGAWPKIGE